MKFLEKITIPKTILAQTKIEIITIIIFFCKSKDLKLFHKFFIFSNTLISLNTVSLFQKSLYYQNGGYSIKSKSTITSQ